MELSQKRAIILLLLISFCASIIIPLVIKILVVRRKKDSSCCLQRNTAISNMLIFIGCLAVAIWCTEYANGYFSIIDNLNKGTVPPLTWWEECFNSVVRTLQTFSLDGGYEEFIKDGKKMIEAVAGNNVVIVALYRIYASFLNIIAPVAGGAIIFEVIASIFPKVRLWLYFIAFWREKYYFSELNQASLVLAKSICCANNVVFKKPVIIFTETNIDDQEENGVKLLLEAKNIGAICVKEDLSHVRKNKYGMRKFFLIDEIESGNLQMLAVLANSYNCEYLKKSEIYLFTNDDAYIQVEKRVYDLLMKDSGFLNDDLPVLVPIQSYRNLISDLLVDVPLYEPLIGKKAEKDGTQTLRVSILGTGDIGKEMFLTTYWLGQILNCTLVINVLSEESEEDFWSKIDYINPEIRHTTQENDPILRINREGDMADRYCKVNYHKCDVKSSALIECLTDPSKEILDTDYFLVALGSDDINISVANTVQKYIGQYHISVNKQIKTVIAYVVYDNELSASLNTKKFYNFVNDKCDVYMQAIGSLQDVYSVQNVFLSDYDPFAQNIHNAYISINNSEKRAETHKDRRKDDYKYWANMARVMHRKYKIYSIGMITESMFDYPQDSNEYDKKLKEIHEKYRKISTGQIELNSQDEENEYHVLLHKLSWLEHRRWCAFTRVKGFRGTVDYDIYGTPGIQGGHKQMDLKLHPCLVECDQKGIRAKMSSNGEVDTDSLFRRDEFDDFDLLDDLSLDLHNKGFKVSDFKQFDYPRYDFE